MAAPALVAALPALMSIMQSRQKQGKGTIPQGPGPSAGAALGSFRHIGDTLAAVDKGKTEQGISALQQMTAPLTRISPQKFRANFAPLKSQGERMQEAHRMLTFDALTAKTPADKSRAAENIQAASAPAQGGAPSSAGPVQPKFMDLQQGFGASSAGSPDLRSLMGQ